MKRLRDAVGFEIQQTEVILKTFPGNEFVRLNAGLIWQGLLTMLEITLCLCDEVQVSNFTR